MRSRITMTDIVSLTVGYSMAALLTRALGPTDTWPGLGLALALALVFLWLGLAMSGPLILLGRRRGRPTGESTDQVERDLPVRPIINQPHRLRSSTESEDGSRPISPELTWAELAWIAIGVYWLMLTLLIAPWQLPRTSWVAVVPVLALPILIRIGQPAPRDEITWTHRTGMVLLMSWIPVWIALILIFRG